MTRDMLQQFRWVTGAFCTLLSLVPLYFLLRGRIWTGSNVGLVSPHHLVDRSEEPLLFYAALTFSVLFVAAFWWLRSWLINSLSRQL